MNSLLNESIIKLCRFCLHGVITLSRSQADLGNTRCLSIMFSFSLVVLLFRLTMGRSISYVNVVEESCPVLAELIGLLLPSDTKTTALLIVAFGLSFAASLMRTGLHLASLVEGIQAQILMLSIHFSSSCFSIINTFTIVFYLTDVVNSQAYSAQTTIAFSVVMSGLAFSISLVYASYIFIEEARYRFSSPIRTKPLLKSLIKLVLIGLLVAVVSVVLFVRTIPEFFTNSPTEVEIEARQQTFFAWLFCLAVAGLLFKSLLA